MNIYLSLYLFDGALLQMLLHCFLDEKLLLVELHPWVFFHYKFQDGLVRSPSPVVARLRKRVNKIKQIFLLNHKKKKSTSTRDDLHSYTP